MSLATAPLIVGAAIAMAVVLFARVSAFDRSPAFYPTVLIVTASYYVLFAVLYGGGSELGAESLVMAAFIALAVIGLRTSLWLVVAGFIAHGLFDVARHSMLEGRGVPSSWPAFCLAFDVMAAAGMAGLLLMEGRRASAADDDAIDT